MSAIQLEKKLKAQIDVWECEQGRDFLVNGLKFLQYVEEQWEQQQAEKEREKLARVGQPAAPCRIVTVAILNVIEFIRHRSPNTVKTKHN